MGKNQCVWKTCDTLNPSVAVSASALINVVDPGEQVAHVLVEFACSKGSRFGRERYSRFEGKLVARISLAEDDDMISSSGLRNAFRSAEKYVGKVPVFLRGSLPCTLGSVSALTNNCTHMAQVRAE